MLTIFFYAKERTIDMEYMHAVSHIRQIHHHFSVVRPAETVPSRPGKNRRGGKGGGNSS